MNEIVIIALLILLNGALAMSEIALISVRKSYLANESKRGNRNARLALRIIESPDKFLSTIQIGITIIGILTGIYSGSVLTDMFSAQLILWGVPESYSHVLAQGLIVGAVTYFSLIFGELVPKRIGMSIAEKITKLVARPMYYLSVISSPFVWLLSKSTSFVFQLLGLKNSSGKITEEEIRSMIHEGTKEGEVQEVEQDIVDRVFRMGDLKVSSIMTHRSELICLDRTMSIEKIKDTIRHSPFGVYPVIDQNIDNVVGMVTLKELFFRVDLPNFTLESILSEPDYFHEHISVFKALEQMKQKGIKQSLICDEFGICQGMITLTDILEGLVGNVDNVHEEPEIIKRKEGEGWFVDGQCTLYDFLSYFKKEYDLSHSNYNTIGGLILEKLQHIPVIGETINWEEFSLEVVDMDGARIDKLLVTMLNEEEIED
ncbi:MAG: hemolysin family protein [Bacteroidales bacterium]